MKPNRINRFRIKQLLAVTGFFAMSVGSQAVTKTWLGTSNVWDTASTPNWAGPTTWATGDDAIFNSTGAGFVDIAVGGVSAQSLIFNANGYTIQGGGLTLTGTRTITTASGISTAISSAIGGGAGLTKDGAGTLTLTGANGYTGTTAISSVGLNFAGGTTINSTGAVALTGTTTTGTVTGSRAILFNGNATLNNNSLDASLLTLKITQPPTNGVAFYQNAAGTITTTGDVIFDVTPFVVGTAFRVNATDLSFAATSGTLTLNTNAPTGFTGTELNFAITSTLGAKLVAPTGATIDVTGAYIGVTGTGANTISSGEGILNIASDIKNAASVNSELTLVNAVGHSGGTINISGTIIPLYPPASMPWSTGSKAATPGS